MHVKPAMVLMGLAGGVLLYGVYFVWGNLWVVVLAHAIANLGSWLMMRNKVNRLVYG